MEGPPIAARLEAPPGATPGRRRRSKVDWELIACGWAGHVLVGTDVARVRDEDAVVVRDAGGVRWHRCLRCDSWVALPEPTAPVRPHPPNRQEIEIPLRGKALRDRVILRLIAIDRAFHFLVLGILGVAVLAFANSHNLRHTFYRVLTAVQNGVGGGPVQQGGHAGIFRELDRLFTLKHATLRDAGIALVLYALLEGVEAIGLWLGRRWAEYLTFVATTVLLVPEVYELLHRVTALKLIGFLINVAVVIYLLFAKRLFGLRGGGAVDERERAAAMSWETIERASPPHPA